MDHNPETPTNHDGRPLLKWVGGKRRLLPELLQHVPDDCERVVEPFAGGLALSFALATERPGLEVVANDLLTPLVDIYRAVQHTVEGFIDELEGYTDAYLVGDKATRKAFYYAVRDRYMAGELDGPAVLYFLLRTCFNGLYRAAKNGRFGTAVGTLRKPGFHQPARLRSASQLMQGWDLRSGDFADTLDAVDEHTVVLVDPPYRETFTGYHKGGFGEEDQLRVVEFCAEAAARGARVICTNSDTGDHWYRRQFGRQFGIRRVNIRYAVSCTAAGRGERSEVIVTNDPALVGRRRVVVPLGRPTARRGELLAA